MLNNVSTVVNSKTHSMSSEYSDEKKTSTELDACRRHLISVKLQVMSFFMSKDIDSVTELSDRCSSSFETNLLCILKKNLLI